MSLISEVHMSLCFSMEYCNPFPSLFYHYFRVKQTTKKKKKKKKNQLYQFTYDHLPTIRAEIINACNGNNEFAAHCYTRLKKVILSVLGMVFWGKFDVFFLLRMVQEYGRIVLSAMLSCMLCSLS